MHIGLCIKLVTGVCGLCAIVSGLSWGLYIVSEGSLGIQTVHRTGEAVGEGGGHWRDLERWWVEVPLLR